MKEYRYKPLSHSKKRIRLLQLSAGTIHNSSIDCELVEADYDNDFHIPTEVTHDEYGNSKGKDVEAGAAPEAKEDEKSKEWMRVKGIEIKYQALSWCWGSGNADYCVTIRDGKHYYKKAVRRDLALALKNLRKPTKIRTLWIDAICINQADSNERNQQVQMMARIYTRAEKVCIWLGEDNQESALAIKFIKEEITQLNDFDKISSDKKYSDKWRALLMLMQREWFSRRWVVQEISLAKDARIYCGPDSIRWKEFAVAVELFVEVESATHGLSEVMQKDAKFEHIPGWFEHVSELGASLLVHATGKVFRAHGTPMDDHYDDGLDDPIKAAQYFKEVHTIDPLDRKSLLSLEYLVTTMFIFKATECRDSIYSMLAIARDAAPYAEQSSTFDDTNQSHTIDMSFNKIIYDCFLAEKPFVVDYARPYSDVCRDFVEFCIQRSNALDPVQALDILCRPWALDPPRKKSVRLSTEDAGGGSDQNKRIQTQRSWLVRECRVRVEFGWVRPHKWKYEKSDKDVWHEDVRTLDEYLKHNEAKESGEMVQSFGCSWSTSFYGGLRKASWKKPEGWDRVKDFLQGPSKHISGLKRKMKTMKGNSVADEVSADLDLPSWVARAKNAPFELHAHPGFEAEKTGRAHAEPLVGSPKDGHRNYSAAQTRKVDLQKLKFKKRPYLGHYSLYVEGFVIDEVAEVAAASQGGNIPASWLDMTGWNPPYNDDPPAEFWRTIVADRGSDDRNPPAYYARACKESVKKGGIASGRVNTTALINNERNSIIAAFCRRVQAVIWGRSLFRTKKGRLGIAAESVQPGDKICILYGCTVPVILNQQMKTPNEQRDEALEDRIQAFKSCVQRLKIIRERKARYRGISNENPGWEEEVKVKTAEVNKILEMLKGQREENEERTKRQMKAMQAMKEKDHGSPWGVSTPWNWWWGDSKENLKREQKQMKEAEKEMDDTLHYIFRGGAYVNGCMDGEALRAKFYEESEDRLFELR
ncbi:hypothetical protein HBH61_132400 [Parastagonospora nodorum]|nr:hypothetical protein HBH61_132400 [Parastagonospora nodorum]KAH4931180.1 hypothetical protein HBI79_109460 [Parastagonospora nodorum]